MGSTGLILKFTLMKILRSSTYFKTVIAYSYHQQNKLNWRNLDLVNVLNSTQLSLLTKRLQMMSFFEVKKALIKDKRHIEVIRSTHLRREESFDGTRTEKTKYYYLPRADFSQFCC